MRAPSDRKRRTDAVLDRLAALAPAHRDALREALLARRVRGHDAVAQALAALGITHLYAMPGLPTDETIGACARAGLIVTGTRHQQATVMMAAAHNYIAGRLAAVAMVSSGVAVTNATTGVQVAQDNGWPVLLLAGAVEQAAAGMGAFTELDGMRAMRPLAKDCLCAGSTADIGRTLAAAARIACDGRPGAVHVDLPEDSLSGFAVPAHADIGAPSVDTLPDAAALDRAADLLLGARAPLLVFGKGVRWDDAYRPLRALVDHLQLPFIASPMGRGLLPDDHPLSRSAEQGRALAAADCVLLVGARLNWTFRYGAEIRPGTPIVQIDCCDAAFAEGPPRALTLAGRAGTLLPALLERIRQLRPLPAPVPDSTGGVIAAPSAAATDRPTPDEVAAALARRSAHRRDHRARRQRDAAGGTETHRRPSAAVATDAGHQRLHGQRSAVRDRRRARRQRPTGRAGHRRHGTGSQFLRARNGSAARNQARRHTAEQRRSVRRTSSAQGLSSRPRRAPSGLPPGSALRPDGAAARRARRTGRRPGDAAGGTRAGAGR
jgi:thiamine pyrophosphate-dependent acetolactate synthase large subunit-like protein